MNVTIRLHHIDGHAEDIVRTPDEHYRHHTRIGNERREMYEHGDRVRLVALAQSIQSNGEPGFDDRPNLPPGTCGTVQRHFDVVDGGGSLFVKWDNGSSLSATADDVVEKIEREDV